MPQQPGWLQTLTAQAPQRSLHPGPHPGLSSAATLGSHQSGRLRSGIQVSGRDRAQWALRDPWGWLKSGASGCELRDSVTRDALQGPCLCISCTWFSESPGRAAHLSSPRRAAEGRGRGTSQGPRLPSWCLSLGVARAHTELAETRAPHVEWGQWPLPLVRLSKGLG